MEFIFPAPVVRAALVLLMLPSCWRTDLLPRLHSVRLALYHREHACLH